MTNVDQWVKDNTFYCQQYKAKISKAQCKFNCAKTCIVLGRYKTRKTKVLWHHLLLNELTLLFGTCRDCEKFKESDIKDLVKVSYDKNVFKNRKSPEFFRELIYD